MIDFNLTSGAPIKNNEVDLIIQQIDILFDTNLKEVLGFELFGSKYDEYLYKLQVSNEYLKQTVQSDIESLELFGYKPDVNVHLLQGTEQDIALIEIILTKDGDSYTQIYKIS